MKNSSKKTKAMTAIGILLGILFFVVTKGIPAAEKIWKYYQSPTRQYQNLMQESFEACQRGEYENAFSLYEQAKELQAAEEEMPFYVYKACISLAEDRLSKKDYDGVLFYCDAVPEARKADYIDVLKCKAYLGMAMELIEAGNAEEAKEWLSEVTTYDRVKIKETFQEASELLEQLEKKTEIDDGQ